MLHCCIDAMSNSVAACQEQHDVWAESLEDSFPNFKGCLELKFLFQEMCRVSVGWLLSACCSLLFNVYI